LRRPLFDTHDKKPAISGFFIAAFCCLLLPFAVLSVRTNRNRNQSSGLSRAHQTIKLKARSGRLPESLSSRCLQTLDSGRQTALMASSLVLVNDALVRNDVDGLDRRLVDFCSLGLVAGIDRLANGLDGGAEFRAQRRVVRVCLDGRACGLVRYLP
jgi:hypothetical protein